MELAFIEIYSKIAIATYNAAQYNLKWMCVHTMCIHLNDNWLRIRIGYCCLAYVCLYLLFFHLICVRSTMHIVEMGCVLHILCKWMVNCLVLSSVIAGFVNGIVNKWPLYWKRPSCPQELLHSVSMLNMTSIHANLHKPQMGFLWRFNIKIQYLNFFAYFYIIRMKTAAYLYLYSEN